MTSVGVMASAVNVGGGTDVLSEPFNNLTAWTAVGTVTTIAGGRTGNCANMSSGSSYITYALSANANEYVMVGFAWKTNSLASKMILQLRSGGAGTLETVLWVETDGSLKAGRGGTGTVLATSSAGVVTTGTWYYVEVYARLHNTLGSVQCRINGTSVFNATSLDTAFAANTVYDAVRVLNDTSVSAQFDDLYVTVGPNAAFKGSITIP